RRTLVSQSLRQGAQLAWPERRVQSLCRAAAHDGRQLRLRQQLDQILLRRRLALIGCGDDTGVGGLAPAALGKPVRDLLRRPVGTPVAVAAAAGIGYAQRLPQIGTGNADAVVPPGV